MNLHWFLICFSGFLFFLHFGYKCSVSGLVLCNGLWVYALFLEKVWIFSLWVLFVMSCDTVLVLTFWFCILAFKLGYQCSVFSLNFSDALCGIGLFWLSRLVFWLWIGCWRSWWGRQQVAAMAEASAQRELLWSLQVPCRFSQEWMQYVLLGLCEWSSLLSLPCLPQGPPRHSGIDFELQAIVWWLFCFSFWCSLFFSFL